LSSVEETIRSGPVIAPNQIAITGDDGDVPGLEARSTQRNVTHGRCLLEVEGGKPLCLVSEKGFIIEREGKRDGWRRGYE
jgi:hypothetical protein